MLQDFPTTLAKILGSGLSVDEIRSIRDTHGSSLFAAKAVITARERLEGLQELKEHGTLEQKVDGLLAVLLQDAGAALADAKRRL